MKILPFALATASSLLASVGASALPVAQLDIVGTDVTYDASTQTVVTSDPAFTLYGYGLTSAGKGKVLDTSLDWYLSIAVSPQTNAPANIGSFSVDGTSYDASDMIFGTPPLDEYASNSTTLATHSIYDTLYMTLAVDWTGAPTRSGVDVQASPGTDPLTNPGPDLMYVDWLLDVSGLLTGFNMHFDLFGVTTGCSLTNFSGCKVVQFAPFSHDAGTSVPEPLSITLFGAGLLIIGFASGRRRRSDKVA